MFFLYPVEVAKHRERELPSSKLGEITEDDVFVGGVEWDRGTGARATRDA